MFGHRRRGRRPSFLAAGEPGRHQAQDNKLDPFHRASLPDAAGIFNLWFGRPGGFLKPGQR